MIILAAQAETILKALQASKALVPVLRSISGIWYQGLPPAESSQRQMTTRLEQHAKERVLALIESHRAGWDTTGQRDRFQGVRAAS